MIDRISFKIPFGFLGRILEKILIRKQLRNIFNYRYHKLIEFFGPFEEKNDQEKKDLTFSAG